jgi:hypothetical protein
MSGEQVSKYYQKQYERFMNQTKKENLKEAFVKKEPEPEPEEETMYTRLKTNPRRSLNLRKK